MALNSEFERKLTEAKEAKALPSASELLEKQLEEERRKSIEERPLRLTFLQDKSKEIFTPLLESVNKFYLEGKGEISHIMDENAYALENRLDWDKTEYEGYPGGKRITITQRFYGKVVLQAGYDWHKYEFSVNDPDFKTKLQDQILEELKGQNCSWSDHPVEGGDWSLN